MTAKELNRRLDAGEIVSLTEKAWSKLASGFAVVEEHATGCAGTLAIVARGRKFAAVEESARGRRAVRPLSSKAAMRDFVRERMAAYDRMWDG